MAVAHEGDHIKKMPIYKKKKKKKAEDKVVPEKRFQLINFETYPNLMRLNFRHITVADKKKLTVLIKN